MIIRYDILINDWTYNQDSVTFNDDGDDGFNFHDRIKREYIREERKCNFCGR